MEELKPYEEMIPVKHFVCLRCDYVWIPKKRKDYPGFLPMVCPNCNSPYWMSPHRVTRPDDGIKLAKRCHINNELDTLTRAEWNLIIKNQNNRCAICGGEFDNVFVPTKDHIIPITKGGLLTLENTQALCIYCNCKKGTKLYSGLRNSWRGKGVCENSRSLSQSADAATDPEEKIVP